MNPKAVVFLVIGIILAGVVAEVEWKQEVRWEASLTDANHAHIQFVQRCLADAPRGTLVLYDDGRIQWVFSSHSFNHGQIVKTRVQVRPGSGSLVLPQDDKVYLGIADVIYPDDARWTILAKKYLGVGEDPFLKPSREVSLQPQPQ